MHFQHYVDFRGEKKPPKLDKIRDFDPLGVEIELWAMNPKRCARSTYGGTRCRQNPKIPNRFPKNCIWRFFHLVMRKKCAKIFCTKNFSSQEKLLKASSTFRVKFLCLQPKNQGIQKTDLCVDFTPPRCFTYLQTVPIIFAHFIEDLDA